jgi:hypothetical protein
MYAASTVVHHLTVKVYRFWRQFGPTLHDFSRSDVFLLDIKLATDASSGRKLFYVQINAYIALH